MLEIKLNEDKQQVLPYCKRCGELYSEAFYLFEAVDRGQVLAGCLFQVEADVVKTLLYEAAEPGDAFLFDGVLRAGLNYAAGQGIETGEIPEALRADHSGLFEQLNYPSQPRFNIVNFFQKYKSCRSLF